MVLNKEKYPVKLEYYKILIQLETKWQTIKSGLEENQKLTFPEILLNQKRNFFYGFHGHLEYYQKNH